ncbi:hypothetical protein QFZ64_006248 [Streptomyces sp. B3I8]|nr:hypothetical protein [Streptomyces sp. B3I8]
MLFKVHLPFEGVLYRLDQLPHRLEERLALRFFSRLNDGRSSSIPRMARSFSNSLEAKPSWPTTYPACSAIPP